MNKHFHNHLVEISTLEVELSTLDLSDLQKHHLLEIADSSFYHVAIDTVLSELPEDHKKTFLENLASESHSKIWEHLRLNAQNIEGKVKEAIERTRESFLEDLRKLASENSK